MPYFFWEQAEVFHGIIVVSLTYTDIFLLHLFPFYLSIYLIQQKLFKYGKAEHTL